MSDAALSLQAGPIGARFARPTAGTAAKLVLRLAISACLFAGAIWLAPHDLDWSLLSHFTLIDALLCLCLSAVSLGLLAWRWRLVYRRLNRDGSPSIASFVRLSWLALAVNQVVPSVVGGDVLRISMLARLGRSAKTAAASVLVDRAYGLIGLLLLCLAGTFLLDPTTLAIGLAAASLMALGFGALVAAALAGSRYLGRLREVVAFFRGALSLRAGLMFVPAAAAGHAANIAIFLVVAQALGLDLPILPAVSVMAAVLLVSVLPLSIAGWGVREFSLIQALGQFTPDHDRIILASIAYGLIVLVTQAFGFLLLVGRTRP